MVAKESEAGNRENLVENAQQNGGKTDYVAKVQQMNTNTVPFVTKTK